MPCESCKKKRVVAKVAGKTFQKNVKQLIENIKKERVKGYSNGKT